MKARNDLWVWIDLEMTEYYCRRSGHCNKAIKNRYGKNRGMAKENA